MAVGTYPMYEYSALSSGMWLNVIWLRCSEGDDPDIAIHMHRYIHIYIASPLHCREDHNRDVEQYL